jgi:hypothetical protein
MTPSIHMSQQPNCLVGPLHLDRAAATGARSINRSKILSNMLDHPGVFECCLFCHILLTKGHVVHLSILWLLKGGKIPDGFQTITTLKGLGRRLADGLRELLRIIVGDQRCQIRRQPPDLDLGARRPRTLLEVEEQCNARVVDGLEVRATLNFFAARVSMKAANWRWLLLSRASISTDASPTKGELLASPPKAPTPASAAPPNGTARVMTDASGLFGIRSVTAIRSRSTSGPGSRTTLGNGHAAVR